MKKRKTKGAKGKGKKEECSSDPTKEFLKGVRNYNKIIANWRKIGE